MSAPEPETIELPTRNGRSTALAAGAGENVLLVHGFPDDRSTYRFQMPALAAAGYRPVAPTLPGYEPSSQPGLDAAHYHPVTVARDLIGWSRALGGAHLVGHDWGAVAGWLAAAIDPDAFRSVCLMAVPTMQGLLRGLVSVPRQARNSWYIFFFQTPRVAEWALRRNDFALIEQLWSDWSPGWKWEPEAMARVKATFSQAGVVEAALGYYRALMNPLHPEAATMRRLGTGRYEIPILAITGERDGCLDTRLFDHLDRRLFPKGLRVERLPGVGHFAHQEDPAAVNALLIDWLSGKIVPTPGT